MNSWRIAAPDKTTVRIWIVDQGPAYTFQNVELGVNDTEIVIYEGRKVSTFHKHAVSHWEYTLIEGAKP